MYQIKAYFTSECKNTLHLLYTCHQSLVHADIRSRLNLKFPSILMLDRKLRLPSSTILMSMIGVFAHLSHFGSALPKLSIPLIPKGL
jgi:hypothetical protein